MLRYHGGELAAHHLMLLCHIPETTEPTLYAPLLPEVRRGGRVDTWQGRGSGCIAACVVEVRSKLRDRNRLFSAIGFSGWRFATKLHVLCHFSVPFVPIGMCFVYALSPH